MLQKREFAKVIYGDSKLMISKYKFPCFNELSF
jgi:hypothetical protein